jgi:polyhydroxyalkanoate synthesis repressor PhaR
MVLIKRYANRKLYDTQARQYITLEQIGQHIRQGQEVQIIDNVTGEDLTARIFSQIIAAHEKKGRGFLPRSVLGALVEAGGKPISTLRQKLESPLEFLRQVDDEIERRLQTLVQRGELAEETARKLRDRLLAATPFGHPFIPETEELAQILAGRGLPTRADVQRIADQLDDLLNKLNQLT